MTEAVRVRDDNGDEKTWTIVGEGESDLAAGMISWKSPMAKALLGKRVGDVVTVARPAGEIEVEVMAIVPGDVA